MPLLQTRAGAIRVPKSQASEEHHHRPSISGFVVGILLAAIGLLVLATSIHGQAREFPNPAVQGPIEIQMPTDGEERDYPFFSRAEWLAERGYIEEEYFVEGTANRYDMESGEIADGGHPYRTRLVIRRPVDPADFNGTVLLEWQNVTAGYDLDALWSPVQDHLVEAGYAWAGISAQRVGVNHLREWSPTRYGSLDVTAGGTIENDALSYDIFGQAAKAIRSPGSVDVMGGLRVREVIGKGASQSAGRLTPFYNVVQPLYEPVIDLLYLSVGGGETRTDQPIPVFRILSETDILRVAAAGADVQPDSETNRRWEVAGTSHSGYTGFMNRRMEYERDFGQPLEMPTCDRTPYSRIPMPYVMNAAYAHMVRWIREGVPPPTAPLITRTGSGVGRTELGNATGGIQLAEHSAPTALNDGSNSGSGFCRLYGSHEPFDDATLAALYPTKAAYLARVQEAVAENLRMGYILPTDAEKTMAAARSFERIQ